MNILWLDLETRSEVDLIACGAGRYIEHCTPILIGFALNGEEPIVIDNLSHMVSCSREIAMFHKYVRECDAIVAQNGNAFDRPICEKSFVGFPKNKMWYDSLIKAAAHNYPASLSDMGSFLKIKMPKQFGIDGIKRFCIPIKTPDGTLKYNRPEDYPEEWARFKEYVRYDIHAMRECWYALPDINYPKNLNELELVEIDRRINSYGFRVDVDFAVAAVQYLKDCKAEADEAITKATNGRVTKITQNKRMLAMLNDLGAGLPGLGKKDRSALNPTVSDDIAELLSLRDSSVKTSTAKYTHALHGNVDGIMRYTLRVYAARTGRWGGKGFQPHNLPRYGTEPEEQNLVCEAFKSHDVDTLDLIVDRSIPITLSNHLRSSIIPREGNVFVIFDYSNIEGRGLAYLAKETVKLDVFKKYDAGKGADPYIAIFALVFGTPIDKVTKADRQMGKTVELAGGYQGAVGALATACEMFGIPPFEDEKAVEIIKAWRAAHPNTVKLWYACDRAFRDAISGHSSNINGLIFSKMKEDVVIKLPSGRYLFYPRARLSEDDTIEYAFRKGFASIYGGKIVENIVQAFCRDILADALIKVHRAGFKIPLHVHDEIVVEAEVSKVTEVFNAVETIMLKRLPQWCQDFPMAVKGMVRDRYAKE